MNTRIPQPPDYYFRQYSCKISPQHIFYNRKIREIMSFLPVKNKDSVLDCGCGSGVLLYVLKQKGCQVFGIDKKIDSLMFCRKLCKGGHFLATDLLDFTLKKKFDFVVCCDVIEHFDDFDKIKVIGNLCNHLNEKGCLLISYPSRLYFSIEPALI